MSKSIKLLIIAAFCLLITAGAYFYLQIPPSHSPSTNASKKILYWVDAMEPQIHYDGPGKSRMNMDLTPVYEEAKTEQSPAVANANHQHAK